MSRTTSRVSPRPRKRSFVESVEFPRRVVGAFVLIIGLVFWLGAISDAAGMLWIPGVGSMCYFAAVIGVAAFLVYGDRNRRSTGKDCRLQPRRKATK